jgi:hypothetical protein
LVSKEPIVTLDQLVAVLDKLYAPNQWPKPFSILSRPPNAVADGGSITEIAKECGLTKKRAREVLVATDRISALFGGEVPTERAAKASRQMLGNLIVGLCAERIFVEHYKREAATTELELSDLRESRSDTDYRLINGKKRPVYRINIKFVGSMFRRAKELVGLEPEDCFALATYKIKAALDKQEADRLPFLFIVVSVPGLSAEAVGSRVDSELLDFLGLVTQTRNDIKKKRDIQDHIVRYLEGRRDVGFLDALQRIERGAWYVLSARRADQLLRDKLFERVYALRIRGFAQQFRGAELDMHFSFSQDLAPLDAYLHKLREFGYPVVTTMLERGEY